VQYIVGVQFASNDDPQAAARELINDGQHTERSAVLRPILYKVVGPDMSGTLRPKTDTGSVIEPEPAALGLFLWP
jgi:hypothetical protein